MGETTTGRLRVLLVTNDDEFSGEVKARLPGIEALSLTEGAVWTAIRAGIDVTRGASAVLLDNGIGGLLQLRLYERLRPDDGFARTPVIFSRSKLTPATSGFAHDLDFYQAVDTAPDQTARLIAHLLGVPIVPQRVAARLAAPAATAVSRRGHRASHGAVVRPGLLQRLGLWGVGAALVGFTFWPLVGSGPVTEVVQASLPNQLAAPADVTIASTGP